ncbi:MAG: DUF3500 domain-containing protein [Opitutaceae bacterium]
MTQAHDPSTLAAAAIRFLNSLDRPSRELAQRSFDDANRVDWSFIPRPRAGLGLKSMSDVQRKAAFTLLDATLSESGAARARAIMEFEGILGRIEGNTRFRDPQLYFFTVFGAPSATAPWGWRIEGHHLSLNYTSDGRGGASITPAFWGANPARVPHGPETGRRALPAEEDLARALILSLEPVQRAEAIIDETAYPEILSGTDPRPRIPEAAGIRDRDLTADEQNTLWSLIRLHLDQWEPGLTALALERIGPPAEAAIRFAWAGGLLPGQGHYYRIHGASFLIEYDNTQNDANHIHTVWRDLTDDFGYERLGEHLRKDHP